MRWRRLAPVACAAVLVAFAAGAATFLPIEQVGDRWVEVGRSFGERRAPTVAGAASVTDGDTLRIGGQRIRLHGIDAPERDQSCRDANGRGWACGRRATEELQELVGWRTVSCHQQDVDRYGRIVARCFAGEVDVAEHLVLEGLALAYTRYSWDYVIAETRARAAGRGMWSGDFDAPWDWRRG